MSLRIVVVGSFRSETQRLKSIGECWSEQTSSCHQITLSNISTVQLCLEIVMVSAECNLGVDGAGSGEKVRDDVCVILPRHKWEPRFGRPSRWWPVRHPHPLVASARLATEYPLLSSPAPV